MSETADLSEEITPEPPFRASKAGHVKIHRTGNGYTLTFMDQEIAQYHSWEAGMAYYASTIAEAIEKIIDETGIPGNSGACVPDYPEVIVNKGEYVGPLAPLSRIYTPELAHINVDSQETVGKSTVD